MNYVDRINSWKLEEFIEILIRKIHNLPFPRVIDGGEDWDIELDSYDEGSVEPDLIDFNLYVLCNEDYHISVDTFLEILSKKYFEELKSQQKSFKKKNPISKGKFRDNKKSGRWEYYTDSGKLISCGNYLKGKREGKWHIYYPLGKNEILEVRNYITYIKEIPFFDSYYPNGSIKMEGKYIGNGKYKTVVYRESGEMISDLEHDLQ